MHLCEAPWTAVAAATAFRPRFTRPRRKARRMKGGSCCYRSPRRASPAIRTLIPYILYDSVGTVGGRFAHGENIGTGCAVGCDLSSVSRRTAGEPCAYCLEGTPWPNARPPLGSPDFPPRRPLRGSGSYVWIICPDNLPREFVQMICLDGLHDVLS